MENQLKIFSYNINKSQKTKAIVKNVKDIANSGADIICLQEVRYSLNDFIVDAILKELGKEWQANYFLSEQHNSFDFGLAFLWKSEHLQAINFHSIQLPVLDVFNPLWQFLQLLYHGKAGPHLRGAFVGTFLHNSRKKIRITNLHLDWQGRTEHRINQIKHLKNALEKTDTVDCEIVCGDFNTIGLFNRRKQKQVEKIITALGEQFENINEDLDKTSVAYRQTLDHIFIKGFGLKAKGIYKIKGSDHYPVMATVTYK